jgi:hypothetical protein
MRLDILIPISPIFRPPQKRHARRKPALEGNVIKLHTTTVKKGPPQSPSAALILFAV